jgi:hypothetical protein
LLILPVGSAIDFVRGVLSEIAVRAEKTRRTKTPGLSPSIGLEHDPEKCEAVFGIMLKQNEKRRV